MIKGIEATEVENPSSRRGARALSAEPAALAARVSPGGSDRAGAADRRRIRPRLE